MGEMGEDCCEELSDENSLYLKQIDLLVNKRPKKPFTQNSLQVLQALYALALAGYPEREITLECLSRMTGNCHVRF
jgi:hypothetical protein